MRQEDCDAFDAASVFCVIMPVCEAMTDVSFSFFHLGVADLLNQNDALHSEQEKNRCGRIFCQVIMI